MEASEEKKEWKGRSYEDWRRGSGVEVVFVPVMYTEPRIQD